MQSEPRSSAAGQRFARAAITLLAVIATFVTVEGICRLCGALPAPAILGAILAIGLARRHEGGGAKAFFVAPAIIAATALAAAAVGWLLHASPFLGAVAFTGGMFLSVYLRNFGAPLRRAGALIALPLVAMLVAPARADAPGGPLVDIALVIAAGICAYFFATAARLLGARVGIEPPAVRFAAPPRGGGRERSGMPATTKLALQMAVALGTSFVVGFAAFPQHWGWTVLTAFIVSSGARGRGDAAYKGILRLGGAIAGTIAAALLTHVWFPTGVAEACAIFGFLFLGLALRDVNYAYWAACMTLVLALLSHPGGSVDLSFLGMRLEAILAGAACAVAAAWFVFPIKTVAVIRRRLADALLAFDELVANAHVSQEMRADKLAVFEHRLKELNEVAAPVRWHRRVVRRSNRSAHPATWIDLASALREHANRFGENTADAHYRGTIRRAIAVSRGAIASHGKSEGLPVGDALKRLHDILLTRG